MRTNEQDEVARQPPGAATATVDFFPDPDPLAPAVYGEFVIGYVEEIHGPEAAPCDYRLTRFEARMLARHWAEARLKMALDRCFHSQTDSAHLRLEPYASIRLARIAEVIGEGPVEEEVERAESEMRRRFSAEEWGAFRHGTREGWDRAAEETYRSLKDLDRKREDEVTKAAAWLHLCGNPEAIYLDAEAYIWSLAPDDRDESGGRLVLRVTSPRGVSGDLPGYETARPADWQPPYGLC